MHVCGWPRDALVIGQLHAPHMRAQRHDIRHLERLRIPAIGRVNHGRAVGPRAALRWARMLCAAEKDADTV